MRRIVTTDLAEVNSWYTIRALPELTVEAMPNTGYIEPGVGAGWVYFTNGPFAFLDGYITNPEASAAARHLALESITSALTTLAKAEGYTRLVAFTQNSDIADRAVARGYRFSGYFTMMTLEV